MARIGKKLRNLEGGRVAFMCPGCGMMHFVVVDGSRGWTWNGDGDRPTITPSVLVRTGHFVEPQGKHCDQSGDPDWPCDCLRCHSFVEAGRIRFLGDCTHTLAGQTVDLPDAPGA